MSKILIFSTEETIREKIKNMLCDHYDMILTDSIEQCQECIKNTDIGTLIFDVDKQDKPLVDIEAIHSDNPSLKVISLGRDEQTTKEAIKVGASGYILKPIKPDELLAVCK